MKKKYVVISVLLVLFCVVFYFVNREIRYQKGIECFNNKIWYESAKKLENLNYKDSQEKYQIALFNNYLQMADADLSVKSYRKALEDFKKALLLKPNDIELQEKVKNLELIVKEEDIRQEIERKQIEEENRLRKIRSKISDTAFYPIPTKFGEGYDNTIRRYGVATINRINRLAPKAAELVAQNPRCTKVIAVDVSDERSTRNSLTFYCDCGDINNISSLERFYVTEKEINANIKPKSIKEQMENFDKGKCMLMCEAQIKSRLNYPSTFKTNPLLNSIQVGTMGTIVTINFKAKNAFNLELNHVGRCYYNDKGLTDVTIEER